MEITFFNTSDLKDQISNTTNKSDEDKSYLDDNKSSWIFLDLFYFTYGLAMLCLVLKKHWYNLQPVHILTLNGLVDFTLLSFFYVIIDLIYLIWSVNKISNVVDFSIYFIFYLDLVAQDLNGFIFVGFDVYYHEWVTNNVAYGAVVTNKIIGISTVALGMPYKKI